MRNFFKKQLKRTKPVTEEQLGKLRGKTYYNNKYQEGDKILTFFEDQFVSESNVRMVVNNTTEKELSKLNEDFYLTSISNNIPILRKKEDYGK